MCREFEEKSKIQQGSDSGCGPRSIFNVIVKMRIVTTYIFKEIATHSLLGVFIFSFVLFVPQMNRLLELVARRNVSALTVVELFLLPLPSILIMTIPMGVLVGILTGLSRMASDGEFIALRAAGVGAGRIVRPTLLFAALGWALASAMSLYWAPRAAKELDRLKWELQTSQAPYEVRPRVFIEQIPNLLVFLRDTRGAIPTWHHVFIADTSDRDNLKTTTAESGFVVKDPRTNALTLHLSRGGTHEIDPQESSHYSIITFDQTDFPLDRETRSQPPSGEIHYRSLNLIELLAGLPDPSRRNPALVELNYRFAIPFASLVLALVGIPLGVQTRKGGKSIGFVFTILLVFIYYMFAASGLSLSKQGRVPPWAGLWFGNAVFALAGLAALRGLNRTSRSLGFLAELGRKVIRLGRPILQKFAFRNRSREQKPPRSRFLQVLDGYVLRGFLGYFGLVVLALLALFIVFDFYQLFGHILKNEAGPTLLLSYYRYLIPQAIYFPIVPLGILVAVLIYFSLITKTNQITAAKAAGVSLYRVSAPVVAVAALFSAGLFVLEENYLPEINRRQDALRNQIKGKPPQTFFNPYRRWIFGQESRIFNYRFFDSDRNIFAALSVFELDPDTFQINRRIFAERAHWEEAIPGWVLENGWVREIEHDRVTHFNEFAVATFPDLTERPEYFKKEVKPSEQMNAAELKGYLKELQQGGFDVAKLSVQFYRKFSYPLMALVVTLIAIPFAFSVGRRGALSGLAISFGIAMVYWSTSSLFEALGALSQIPPLVAAWTAPVLFGLGGIYMLLRVRT